MQQPLLNIAVRAARKGGNLLVRAFDQSEELRLSSAGESSPVAAIGAAAAQAMAGVIRYSYPDHEIISRFGRSSATSSLGTKGGTTIWTIDPLNGEHNFGRRLPHFALSIAVTLHGRQVVGVTYDPLRNELFTAQVGRGAQFDSYRLRVAQARDLAGAVLAIGVVDGTKKSSAYAGMVEALLQLGVELRSSGSSALDLAYVAAGRLDGALHLGVRANEIAAGEILLQESGALLSDLVGAQPPMTATTLLAGNPKVVQALAGTLQYRATKAEAAAR